jgi:hypothetical protein
VAGVAGAGVGWCCATVASSRGDIRDIRSRHAYRIRYNYRLRYCFCYRLRYNYRYRWAGLVRARCWHGASTGLV